MDIIYEEVGDFHIDIHMQKRTNEMSFFHYHSCYEIFIILDGKREMVVHDKVYQGRTGDVFLIPPQYYHRSGGSSCARITISFTDDYISKYFNGGIIPDMMKCFDVFFLSLGKQQLADVTRLSNEMLNAHIANQSVQVLRLAEILLILSENVDYGFQGGIVMPSMKIASDVLKYINDNYKTLYGIKEIADEFHISSEYLCRIFKKYTGVTVILYLNNCKLNSAKRMIIETDKSINEISDECGFSSAAYFSRLFKKQYHISPVECRKLNHFA